jgi:hypothetical protein
MYRWAVARETPSQTATSLAESSSSAWASTSSMASSVKFECEGPGTRPGIPDIVAYRRPLDP